MEPPNWSWHNHNSIDKPHKLCITYAAVSFATCCSEAHFVEIYAKLFALLAPPSRIASCGEQGNLNDDRG